MNRTLAAGVALVSVLLSGARPARGAKIRIRGKARIEARVAPALLGVEVRGILTDDVGTPIAGRDVLVSIVGGSLPRHAACPPSPAEHRRGRDADEVAVETAADGRFCLLLRGHSPAGQLALRSQADDDFEAAHAQISVDPSARGLRLAFQPRPRTLSLDRTTHDVVIGTRLEPPPSSEVAAPTITLFLLDERGNHLDQQRVEAGGEVGFRFTSDRLAGPGAGRLVVRFPGSPEIGRAEASVVVQRTARVSLQLAKPVNAADPSDGIDIYVAVGSVRGAVTGGSVEAAVGPDSVGTAPVSRGAAHLVAVFDSSQDAKVPIAIRFLPDSPWWVSGRPLELTVPVRGPSTWRRLPWALAAFAIGAWVLAAWRRPARVARDAPASSRRRPTGKPSVTLLEAGPSESGWRGEVIDAHDGTPVPGARVELIVPSFEGNGVVSWTATDDSGRFAIRADPSARREGTRLEVSARWHATLRRPLPSPGTVVIAVVSRRRALLDRIVRWAARRGKPWAQRGDATPGHVARVAERRADGAVRDWAREVEEAAYGPIPPDEARDRAVRAKEPKTTG